jgi:hypothetical protein
MALIPNEEHHNDHRAEQLSLLSPEELKALRSPLDRPSRAAMTASSQTYRIRKQPSPIGEAIQDELPFQ